DQREERARSGRGFGSDRTEDSRAGGQRGGAAAGADFRFLVRSLPRGGDPGEGEGGTDRAAHENPHLLDGPRIRSGKHGRVHAEAAGGGGAGGGRRGIPGGQHQRRGGRAGGRYGD